MTESYVAYCVLDSDGEIKGDIAGLHACTVSNLPYRGIGVAASVLTQPIDNVVARAVEHEKVVERLMRMHAVLPMRFPTTFGSREAVLAMMERRYSDFRDDLQRLGNQVEFGVRVIWPAAAVETEQAKACTRCDSEDPALHGGEAPGRLYMQERYRRHKRRQMLSEQAAQFGRALDAALSEFASERRLRDLATDRFVFDGVYLVAKSRGADLHRAFVDAKDSGPGFRYLFSGPWPPYSFVTMPVAETGGAVHGDVAAALVRCLGPAGSGAGI